LSKTETFFFEIEPDDFAPTVSWLFEQSEKKAEKIRHHNVK